jgi:hypothetical protein
VANPGWYPDPSGLAGSYRYWDGQGWSDQTSSTPDAPPPGAGGPPPANPFDTPTIIPGVTPPTPPRSTQPPPSTPPSAPPAAPTQVGGQFQPYGQVPPGSPYGQAVGQPPGQPSWQQPGSPYAGPIAGPIGGPTGGPAPGSSGGGSTGRAVGLVLAAVVAVLALGVATFFVVRAVTDDDTQPTTAPTATDSTSDPGSDDPTSDDPTSDAPTEPTEPTETTLDPGPEPPDPFTDPGEPTTLQCEGGVPSQGVTGIRGGRVTGGGLSLPEESGYDAGDQATAFTFADGVTAPARLIEDGWIASYALGGLPKDNGFDDLGEAAGAVLECMTGSRTFYRRLSGASLLSSRSITVDGAPAWAMDAEVRIRDPRLSVEGDRAKVVVVDTGDPELFGLYVSVVPIGDQQLIARQTAQEQALRLDG